MKKTFIVLIAALSSGAYLEAQDVSTINNSINIYSNTPIVGSARMMGMGGAMGALGGDVSIVGSNPGALGVYVTSEIQGTLSKFSYANDSRVFNNSTHYASNKDLTIGHFGGVLTLNLFNPESKWKSINLGFNYTSQNIDNYVESPGLEQSPATTGDLFVDRHAYELNGMVSNSNLAIGGNYDNKVYAGLSLNFKTANIDQYDFFQLRHLQDPPVTYDKQYSPFSERSNGFSVSAGIIGRFNNGLRLGFSVESPTWWNMERLYTEYGKDSEDFWGKASFSEDRTITSSTKLTGSVGYVLNKNLALGIDYTLAVSAPKISDAGGDLQSQFENFMQEAYTAQSKLNVGGEYRINKFRLRAGYSYLSAPFKSLSLESYDDTSNPVTNTYKGLYVSNRNTYSGGIGYDFNPIYLDFAYQYSNSKYFSPYFAGDYATLNNQRGDGVSNPTSVVSTVDNKQNNFLITLGLRF